MVHIGYLVSNHNAMYILMSDYGICQWIWQEPLQQESKRNCLKYWKPSHVAYLVDVVLTNEKPYCIPSIVLGVT